MYATRLVSDLKKNPELLSASPDGPNSGYLVIEDEVSKKVERRKKLPFPQNKEALVDFGTEEGGYSTTGPVFFVPVLNLPLSYHCYYAIVPHGEHKGKALTSSRKKDMATTTTTCCCFFRRQGVVDGSPMPLDPKSPYQQFHIKPIPWLYSPLYSFGAVTLAHDGLVPFPLKRQNACGDEYWRVSFDTPTNNLKLDATARGLDPTLRARLPEFKISSRQQVPVVVGKWYSPFTFVREGTVSGQVARSMYYEVTLEQRWERIVGDEKSNVQVFVCGRKAERDMEKRESGVAWYTSGEGEEKRSVGLRKEIVDRMKWEQERGGWVKDKVECPEEEEGVGRRYVLVESFNFRRMISGSLVMSVQYKHFNHIYHEDRTGPAASD